DEARANLVAVVTHALRTPLAVVRAYVELLGSAARRRDAVDPEAAEAADWERSALEQVERLDQTVDSILASLRVLTPDPGPILAPKTARRAAASSCWSYPPPASRAGYRVLATTRRERRRRRSRKRRQQ